MPKKGKPRRDGSGQGVRANRGRGGCSPPKDRNASRKGGGRNRRR